MEEFFTSATAEQREIVEEYVSAAKEIKDVHGHHSTPETERLDAAEVALQKTMTSDQWEDFRVRAKDFIRHKLFTDRFQGGFANFDVNWGRRWVCKRAHELGWTSERFGNFDNFSRGYDRKDQRVERIGKKHQWLALQELMARMADNLAFLGSSWKEDDDEPAVYPGAGEVGLRDIDPSLLTTRTHYDGWAQWGKTWWVPFGPQLRSMGPHERLSWLESDSDLINNDTLIDLRNPKTGRRWLALSGFSSWKGSGVLDGSKEIQRDTWFRLTCIVVRCEDQARIVESLRETLLIDPSSFPEIELHSGYFYLGEYPWRPEMSEFDRWSSGDGFRTFATPIRPTVFTYACARGDYDYSIDRTIRVEMPAPWLAEEMGLRLASGRSLNFVGSDGRGMFYDPSVVEAGPAAALVDREAFVRMLDRQDLSAIWVIAGEKNAYGGSGGIPGFGGCLRHTAIYHLDGDGFARDLHTDWHRPTLSQLEKFFGDDPVPSGVVTKVTAPRN